MEPPAQDITAAEVLERALASLGGKEKLEKLQTHVAVGQVEVAGLSGRYQSWAKAPDKLRQKLDLTLVQIEEMFDGKRGWKKQASSFLELSWPELARLRRDSLFNPLLSYWQQGVTAELKGKESIEGVEVYVLEFRPPQGSSELYYFDTQSFLPLKESRKVPLPEGDSDLTILYGDWHEVGDLRLPFSIVRELPKPYQKLTLKIEKYELNVDLEGSFFQSPAVVHELEPYEVNLTMIPRKIYKENDGLWEEAPTESWVFHVLVQERYGRILEPVQVTVELYSGQEQVKKLIFSTTALKAIKGTSFIGLAAQDEVFDLRHYLSEPIALQIDRMVYTLELVAPRGEKFKRTLEIPVSAYQQKTKLIFPLRGNFIVVGGHDFNEPHKREWSQHYAYDVIGLGPNYELARNDGKANEDFFAWGQEVLAPADGTVIHARNDVPDNDRPGVNRLDLFTKLPEPLWSVAGNVVVIDHGNNEFSVLAHLKQGSVRVKQSDLVKQGQVIGLLGNSGNSTAPHLHYQLMDGPQLFRSDGLPSTFENIVATVLDEGREIGIPRPKRGLFLKAKELGG